MKTSNKHLSLLLSVCLLFSLFAGYVPAASAVGADSAESALPVTAPVLSEEQLPDIIAPEEAQANHYAQRLAAQEPDLNTLLFRNADGTETMRVFSHPVKYLGENGEVKDISLSMLRAADGSVQAASSPIETVFSKQLSGGISLAYKDVQIRMTPQSPVSDGLHAQKLSLASLSADGKTVSYPYGAHTSLEYSLTYAGFKEDIVVEQYTGQTEYSFLLSTGGLLLTEHNGSYFLADEKGEIKASIGDIIVFTADERNNTLGSMAAETVKEGEAYLLTIRLDADYLQDEKTAYPIRIDPTIEITYSGSGAGAIEDVTIIQKGYYYGTAGSLMVGRYETNGLCRVLMRFPNLSLSNISSGTITAATVELRDLMCQGDEDITVDCHIYKKTAPAWSEAVQATWSTVGTAYLGTKLDSKLISYGKGNVSGQSHRYAFNILAAAREWANGSQDPAKGLVFKASDSFENQTGSAVKNWHKTFASYNRASNQPSLSITYQPITGSISLNASQIDVDKGGIAILTATTNPPGTAVTWMSSNTTVATVNGSGMVTGVGIGEANISVYFLDSGGMHTATCKVYVTIADGVYRIQNNYSKLYMSTADRASSLANVYQETADSGSETGLRQMWRIKYLSDGYYSIRPMHNLSTALSVYNNDAYVSSAGTTDSLSALTLGARWKIGAVDNLICLYPALSSTSALSLTSDTIASSTNVVIDSNTGSARQKWALEPIASPPVGVRWYNHLGEPLNTTPRRSLLSGKTKTLSALQLIPVFYSPNNISQQFFWSCINDETGGSGNNIATINSSTGEITAIAPGTIAVRGYKFVGTQEFYLSFKLQVIPQNFTVLGIDSLGHDHKTCLSYAQNKINELEKGRVLSKFGTLTGNECKELLLNSSIVTIRSHGGPISDQYGNIRCTHIVLNEATNASLYSIPVPSMEDDSSHLFDGSAYSNLDLAMFIACYTGADTMLDSGVMRNLPAVITGCGAKTAIGFKDKIICREANTWTKSFYDYLLDGKSIKECIAHANLSVPANSTLLNIAVAGDENYHYIP